MMDISWLLLLVSAAILVSAVLLVVVCVDCRTRGPLVSIRQAAASEEYMPSTEFRIIHASQTTTDLNSIHSPPNLLSPFSNLTDPGTQRRHRSYTPTETESNPSYENPGPESLESDAEEPGYIIVLPEGEVAPTNQSRASTPSSEFQHDYVNIDNPDYLNVKNLHHNTSGESSDDDGNYVNQPPMIHS